MTTGQEHARSMDAYHYWRQFPVRIYWDSPKTIIGTVIDLAEQRAKDGILPLLILQLEDGTRAEILVTQTRLTAELVDKAPAKGDRVKIVYSGEAKRALAGMNPAKEFTVEVRRPGPRPEVRPDGTSGETPSENGPRAGGKTP